MNREPLPDDVRRFIVACITSVPYLECMLLLRNEQSRKWDSKQVGERLYISEKTASELLNGLHASGFAAINEINPGRPLFSYAPRIEGGREIVDRLALVYSQNIIEVTNLIHSNSGSKVQQFADAFRWRKET